MMGNPPNRRGEWEVLETVILNGSSATITIPDGANMKALRLTFRDVAITANSMITPMYLKYNGDGTQSYFVSNIVLITSPSLSYDIGSKYTGWITTGNAHNRIVDGEINIGMHGTHWRDTRGHITVYDSTDSNLYNILVSYYWKKVEVINSILIGVDSPATMSGTVTIERLVL